MTAITHRIDALNLPTTAGFHEETEAALATVVTTTATTALTCITAAFGYGDAGSTKAEIDAPEGATVADMLSAREDAIRR